MVALFGTSSSALASGIIDESAGYYFEGEGSCGVGWVWSAETKEYVRAPMS